MAGCPQGPDSRSEEQDVPQGTRADEKDVQRRVPVSSYGISMRPVDRFPRRSDARTTTTCGPGPLSSPIVNS